MFHEKNITTFILLGLSLTIVTGCNDEESPSNNQQSVSTKELSGTCKELFNARMKEYNDDPKSLEDFEKQFGITKDQVENAVKEDYLNMTEEECVAEKNYSEDEGDL